MKVIFYRHFQQEDYHGKKLMAQKNVLAADIQNLYIAFGGNYHWGKITQETDIIEDRKKNKGYFVRKCRHKAEKFNI